MNKEEHSVYAIKFCAMQKQIDDLKKENKELKHNRDKAIEYANNCLNNINDCVKNGNYTIKELTSWVPTLQCVHNSYLKILKGDSDE